MLGHDRSDPCEAFFRRFPNLNICTVDCRDQLNHHWPEELCELVESLLLVRRLLMVVRSIDEAEDEL